MQKQDLLAQLIRVYAGTKYAVERWPDADTLAVKNNLHLFTDTGQLTESAIVLAKARLKLGEERYNNVIRGYKPGEKRLRNVDIDSIQETGDNIVYQAQGTISDAAAKAEVKDSTTLTDDKKTDLLNYYTKRLEIRARIMRNLDRIVRDTLELITTERQQ